MFIYYLNELHKSELKLLFIGFYAETINYLKGGIIQQQLCCWWKVKLNGIAAFKTTTAKATKTTWIAILVDFTVSKEYKTKNVFFHSFFRTVVATIWIWIWIRIRIRSSVHLLQQCGIISLACRTSQVSVL